jgi:hypothetical protein
MGCIQAMLLLVKSYFNEMIIKAIGPGTGIFLTSISCTVISLIWLRNKVGGKINYKLSFLVSSGVSIFTAFLYHSFWVIYSKEWASGVILVRLQNFIWMSLTLLVINSIVSIFIRKSKKEGSLYQTEQMKNILDDKIG